MKHRLHQWSHRLEETLAVCPTWRVERSTTVNESSSSSSSFSFIFIHIKLDLFGIHFYACFHVSQRIDHGQIGVWIWKFGSGGPFPGFYHSIPFCCCCCCCCCCIDLPLLLTGRQIWSEGSKRQRICFKNQRGILPATGRTGMEPQVRRNRCRGNLSVIINRGESRLWSN